MNEYASTILKDRLEARYAAQVPGLVFYVTRNGQPFADGSFGRGRFIGAPDGELAMTPQTIVHTGSVGKFICAVAIMRLIQTWNWFIDNSIVMAGTGRRRLRPGVGITQQDAPFMAAAFRYGARIGLDTKVYPLIEQWLDQTLIAGYRARTTTANNRFPGTNWADVTLRQLLTHRSGMAGDYDEADLGGLLRADVEEQPGDERPCKYDLRKIVTALVRKDAAPIPATSPNAYSNAAFTVLGGVIEAVTGQLYTTWTRNVLFRADARFRDIDRKPFDATRTARYYEKSATSSSFLYGNRHPDYTHFSAAGGWYHSGAAFCEWVDAVMQKAAIGGGPVLDDPKPLLTGLLGLDWSVGVGRLNGAGKNGAASPGGGQTNAKFAFLRGVGDERYCVFVQANANVSADQILSDGLLAIRPHLDARPGPIPVPAPTAASGLLQAVYWDDGGAVRSAAQVAPVEIKNVSVAGAAANRTDLFGSGTLAGGRSRHTVNVVELRGMLNVSDPGAYRFRLSSDDGSVLWLDDQLLVDHDGNHALESKESPDVQLAVAGNYPVRVQWYNALGLGELYLEWKKPAAAGYEAVPAGNFTPAG